MGPAQKLQSVANAMWNFKFIKKIKAKTWPGKLEHFHASLKSDIVKNSLLSPSLGFDYV